VLGEEDEVLILRVDELVAAEVGQAVDDAGQDHRASAVRGEPEAAWFARVAAEAAGPQWRAVLVEAGESRDRELMRPGEHVGDARQ